MDGGTFEATEGLRDLLDRIERGEEVVITRDGRPVARIVRAAPGDGPAATGSVAHTAAGRLRALATELRSGPPVTLDEIRAWREAGRPS